MSFAEFFAGRNQWLPQPVVVVPAVEEPPVPLLLVTSFEDTGPEVEAAEAVVLGELAALTESCGPWDAAWALFNPIGGGTDVA